MLRLSNVLQPGFAFGETKLFFGSAAVCSDVSTHQCFMFFCLLLVDTSKSIHISNTDQYLFIVIFMYHEFNNKLLTLREPVEIDVRPRCHRTAGTAGRGRKEDHQHD